MGPRESHPILGPLKLRFANADYDNCGIISIKGAMADGTRAQNIAELLDILMMYYPYSIMAVGKLLSEKGILQHL